MLGPVRVKHPFFSDVLLFVLKLFIGNIDTMLVGLGCLRWNSIEICSWL